MEKGIEQPSPQAHNFNLLPQELRVTEKPNSRLLPKSLRTLVPAIALFIASCGGGQGETSTTPPTTPDTTSTITLPPPTTEPSTIPPETTTTSTTIPPTTTTEGTTTTAVPETTTTTTEPFTLPTDTNEYLTRDGESVFGYVSYGGGETISTGHDVAVFLTGFKTGNIDDFGEVISLRVVMGIRENGSYYEEDVMLGRPNDSIYFYDQGSREILEYLDSYRISVETLVSRLKQRLESDGPFEILVTVPTEEYTDTSYTQVCYEERTL